MPNKFKKIFANPPSPIKYPTFIQSALFTVFEKNNFWVEADSLSGRTFGALMLAYTKAWLKKETPLIALISPNKTFHQKSIEIAKKFNVNDLCETIDLFKNPKFVLERINSTGFKILAGTINEFADLIQKGQ